MIHTISQIRVRYAETDRMDVVYHSNYLVWFETARILMLDEIGIPYPEIEASNLRLPVLTASAAYKRPARFDDRLQIHLFMREKPRAGSTSTMKCAAATHSSPLARPATALWIQTAKPCVHP